MSKVKTFLLLGAGYVAGAQAGRVRYEQLKRQATRVIEHPKTQQLAQQARGTVAARLPASVNDGVRSRIAGTAPAPASPVADTVGNVPRTPSQEA